LRVDTSVVALQRLQIIERVREAIDVGMSGRRASRAAGISQSTFIRWQRAWRQGGSKGLETKYQNCGRKRNEAQQAGRGPVEEERN
jgi:transposase